MQMRNLLHLLHQMQRVAEEENLEKLLEELEKLSEELSEEKLE